MFTCTAEDTFYKVSRVIHEWAVRSPFDIRFRSDEIYHHQWRAHVETPVCSIGECVVGLRGSEYDGNSIVYKSDLSQPMFTIDHKTNKVTVHGEIDPMYRDLYEAIVNTFKEENEMDKNKVHTDEVLANAKIIDSALEPIAGDCQPKTFLQKVKECLEEWWTASHWNYYKTHESVRHLKYQFGTTPIFMLGILENTSGDVLMYTENDIRKVILQVKDGRAFPSIYTNRYFTNGWAITAAHMINKKLFPRPATGRNLITDEEVAELKAIMEEFKALALKRNMASSNKILAISDNVVSIKPVDDISIDAKEILKKYTYVRKRNKVMLMKANTVMPAVNQVHFNKVKGYTTILFVDGTRATTKGPAGDDFDPEIGYAMCIMKRMHGNRTQFKKVINEYMKKSGPRNIKIQMKVNRKNKKTDDTQPPTHELF